MKSGKSGRGFWRRHLLMPGAALLLACAVLLAYGRASKKPPGPYALASDLPRGALVYAQFSDLPSLIKRWDESKLRERYLSTTNFQQLQSRHLAMKLLERWGEFNDALGFTLDALTLSEAAENRAALAVYDIGRLEMAFVAPAGEERLAATKFLQGADQFEETELPDGTVYYSRDVEAEGGARRQKFAFASVRGRLVLATSEQLLLRTLANINGKSRLDSLADDPSFKSLSAGAAPHALTVWTDQAKLNGDWYFKHYWVMRNVGQLKNIRACLLDLELKEGAWVERRDFLLSGDGGRGSAAVPAEAARRILSFIPDEAPYFKLRALDGPAGGAAVVRETLVDRPPEETAGEGGRNWSWQSYEDSDFYPGGGDWDGGGYYYLDPRFDSLIDDPADARLEDGDESARGRLRLEAERRSVERLRDSLAPSGPLYAATVQSPRGFDGPLFWEFRRGAVLTLQSPGGFRAPAFESAVAGLLGGRLTIAGSGEGLDWADASCGAGPCRRLTLPALGWGVYYALRGRELVLANSPEMIESLLGGGGRARRPDQKVYAALQDLTVIRLDRREQAFDPLVRKLDAPRVRAYWAERKGGEQGSEPGPSQEFFSGNISSLLDAASGVREVRIGRTFHPARLHEEVEVVFE